MLHGLILAAVADAAAFLKDFTGVWTCGNASYHERWEIRPHRGYDAPNASMADVVYGDPQKPDGFAYVYFVPGANEFRYDDFHADGAQSHLTSPGPAGDAWEWTGTYYPKGAPADPGPDIIWTLSTPTTIARTFSQRVNGAPIQRGADSCTRESP